MNNKLQQLMRVMKMPAGTIDRQILKDVSWWHWMLTIPFVAASLTGVSWAMYVVIGMCAVAAVYFFVRIKDWRPFPVQVRIAYIVWTLTGMLPWMQWMHWVQLFGTTAMVTVGYCPLIRMLCLLPLNRIDPLSWRSVWRVFFKDPCAGGLVKWKTASTTGPVACCALPSQNIPMTCSLSHTKEKSNASTH